MPADLTIFGAKYLVFIDALLAAVVLAVLLYHQPRLRLLRWLVAFVLLVVLSEIAAHIASAIYSDPRPFVGHFKPLIAHAADNGFPSDHGLLAAAIVAGVALARLLWTVPFIVLGVLVDWARVGSGVHHPIDVIGSAVLVALATLVAILVAPPIAAWLLPRLPGALLNLIASPEPSSPKSS